MSYDLFFGCRSSKSLLPREEFIAYFGARQNYQVNDAQAWYSNEDTGVYFSFDYSEPEDVEEDEKPNPNGSSVAFNMNYFRPHIFGLEAEPEVCGFVKQFDLMVIDPQISGMGEGEYSSEGFLRGWNEGNQFGYRAMAIQDPTAVLLTLPTSRIEALWRWNFDRGAKQEETAEGFVPRIMFLDVESEVRTCVAWGDGTPILLPEVDYLLVPRQELAPRGWFGGSKQDLVVLTWEEAAAYVNRFPRVDGAVASYQLFYSERPADIERLIRGKKPPKLTPKGVAVDQVLDRELIAQAKRP